MDAMPRQAGSLVGQSGSAMRGSRIGLRCVGLRLSQQQREAAERRKKRTASKKHEPLQPDTL